MSNISEYTKCSNCGACYNVCPVSAISVKSDRLFYTIEVDNNKCVDCGICSEVCPVNNPQNMTSVISSYAGYSVDANVVKNSSSGGAFYELANIVLADSGVVFAAAYSDDYSEVIFKSTDEVPLCTLMKSKYVESCVGLSFQKIKAELETGREVMFCGAPCQVAGLKKYLKKEYPNLLTCDFSCGGMPSHTMYKEYLSDIKKRLKSPIASVDFRPKVYGWQLHTVKIAAKNSQKYIKPAIQDPYFHSFVISHISTRDYCLQCEFTDNHYSDIILADFWKFKSASRLPDNDTGLSLMITTTEQGEKFIERIRKRFVLTILDNDKATYNLKNKSYSDEFLKKRSVFISKCSESGFMNAVKDVKLESALKPKVKYYVKKVLRVIR